MTGEIMEVWLRGYCRAREIAAPRVVQGGFWLEVAKPQQYGRYILNRFDPVSIVSLIDRITEPAVYIEFPGSRSYSLALLPPGWDIREDAYLMTSDLNIKWSGRTVGDYVFDERQTEHGLEVEVRSMNDEFAARGCYAASFDYAIFDQIATEPAYQNKGLGSAIMARLSDHAARSGLVRGVLVATEAGRGFYAGLGWTLISTIVSIISR